MRYSAGSGFTVSVLHTHPGGVPSPCARGQRRSGKSAEGTGNTAAFLAAALTHLIRNPKDGRTPGSCRVLVLAPTRELAIQIHGDAEVLRAILRINSSRRLWRHGIR